MSLASCRKTAELGETSWRLVSYGPVDAPLTPVASPSISFDDNGRMGGFTGCNSFYGHYEADDEQIILDNELAFTLQGCGPPSPEGMQDEFFRKWLGDVSYSQIEDSLWLYFDEGRQIAEYRLDDE
ncbi:MAG: META domain-containing protein [Candidatus Promineofilum sp.]|nr:META domain-containing protein [Promineifilum sp.]